MADILAKIYQWETPLQRIHILLTYPYVNFVSQYFSKMRAYEDCMSFVNYCNEVIEANRNQLSENEFEDLDRALISYRLFALDGLNRWDEYLEYYEQILNAKKYTCAYGKFRNDVDLNKFVLYEDDNHKYVHFLYGCHGRYELIKRKKAKKDAGKNIEHIKRHQQSQLSVSQLDERYAEMMKLLSWIKKETSK